MNCGSLIRQSARHVGVGVGVRLISLRKQHVSLSSMPMTIPVSHVSRRKNAHSFSYQERCFGAGNNYKDKGCLSAGQQVDFETWCLEHGKKYSSEEETSYRRKVFEENRAFIIRHNEMGNSSYTLGLNAFADLTEDEFMATYCGNLSPEPEEDEGSCSDHSLGCKEG